MRFKKLTTDAQFEEYRRGFLESFQRQSPGASSELPLSYLRASTVIGVFDDEDRMVAGYTLGTSLPLRLLDFVPADLRSNLLVPFQGKWSDCCEITCAWRLPSVSLLFMSSRLWPHALIGVLKSGKRILLGHNQNPRLDKFYTALGPATIYSGISSYGLPSRLFAYNRKLVIVCILGLWAFETPRRFLRGEK